MKLVTAAEVEQWFTSEEDVPLMERSRRIAAIVATLRRYEGGKLVWAVDLGPVFDHRIELVTDREKAKQWERCEFLVEPVRIVPVMGDDEP